MNQSNQTQNALADGSRPPWLSKSKIINEPAFCRAFCENRELRCIHGKLFSVDGEEDTEKLLAEISETVSQSGVTNGVAKKSEALLRALKLHCHSAPIVPKQDEIHVLNGIVRVDGDEGKSPTFLPQKDFCLNRLNVEYDPEIWQHQYYPGHFVDFLCGLLDFEDIKTLQEFIGYCMVPSTKGQKALFLIGNGGEGKSRVGIVLQDLFGKSMVQSNFQRVESDRFFRYNLCDKLLMYDDEMQLEALKSTGYIKNIITAEIPLDVEAKGKQSEQVQLYSRFFCVGNGSPKSLYDKSDGFARRLLILTTKPKPASRVDNPHLSEVFRKEKLQIFCWALDGLRRLMKNNFQFTISAKTRQNVSDAVAENCNVIEFLKECVKFDDPNARMSSKALYDAYYDWCADNGLLCLKRDTFVSWLKMNAGKFGAKYDFHIPAGGKHVRGFQGIYVL